MNCLKRQNKERGKLMEMNHLNEGGMDKFFFCRMKAIFEKKMFYLMIKRKHNSCVRYIMKIYFNDSRKLKFE